MFHYIAECGITPEHFWDYTWYELNLISRRHFQQIENQWNHTRHIMAAFTGMKPSKLLPLSFDCKEEMVQTTKEDAERILNEYRHLIKPAE